MSVLTLHPHATPATADATALWHAYRRTTDARVRDRIVFTLAPLVRHAAGESDADVQRGLEALVDAIEAYEPGRDGSLERFAWSRVRSALAVSSR
jgi:DNA-directed RNA polymerase specialized sigma subunit